MKTILISGAVGLAMVTVILAPAQARVSTVRVDLAEQGEPISKYIYGQFI